MFGRTAKVPIVFIHPPIKMDLPLNPQDYLDQLNTTLKQAYATVRTNNKIRIEKAQLNTKRVLAILMIKYGISMRRKRKILTKVYKTNSLVHTQLLAYLIIISITL
jgi:hypothetical protein